MSTFEFQIELSADHGYSYSLASFSIKSSRFTDVKKSLFALFDDRLDAPSTTLLTLCSSLSTLFHVLVITLF